MIILGWGEFADWLAVDSLNSEGLLKALAAMASVSVFPWVPILIKWSTETWTILDHVHLCCCFTSQLAELKSQTSFSYHIINYIFSLRPILSHITKLFQTVRIGKRVHNISVTKACLSTKKSFKLKTGLLPHCMHYFIVYRWWQIRGSTDFRP